MKSRILVAASVCAGTIIGLGGAVSAGEWAPGNGVTPINPQSESPAGAGVANSECAFNGNDESDETETHLPGESDDVFPWGQTAAGSHSAEHSNGRVQSGGQLVTLFGPDMVKGGGFGAACRPSDG